MPWLSHPYRRFVLLGALLYAGMAWLGYRTAGEQRVSVGRSRTTEYCPVACSLGVAPEMRTDTVAVVHHYILAKGVPLLLRLIDPVVLPDVEVPLVVQRVPPPPPPPPRPSKISCGGFTFSERLPVFPGCDESVPYTERAACGEQKLFEFIYANVRYPAHAREQNCTGTAVIEFIVGKKGAVEEPRIVSDPGCGLGAIALAAVAQMNEQGIVWTPGWQHGLPVRVKYSLPIRFKLN